jgi:hypothetical protein
MMSKAELARKAGLSTLTIDRVEAGRPCRLDTKRKILLALGLRVSDKDRIFAAEDVNVEAPASAPAQLHVAPQGAVGSAPSAAHCESTEMTSGGAVDAAYGDRGSDHGGVSGAVKGESTR